MEEMFNKLIKTNNRKECGKDCSSYKYIDKESNIEIYCHAGVFYNSYYGKPDGCVIYDCVPYKDGKMLSATSYGTSGYIDYGKGFKKELKQLIKKAIANAIEYEKGVK